MLCTTLPFRRGSLSGPRMRTILYKRTFPQSNTPHIIFIMGSGGSKVSSFFFTLPARSAKRLAESIRRERERDSDGEKIYRVAMHVTPSLWDELIERMANGTLLSINNGVSRVRVQLTSVPDHPALISLMCSFCSEHPGLRSKSIEMTLEDRYNPITRRERAFLVHVARQAMEEGVWLCNAEPLPVVINYGPSLHCVSMAYPAEFIEYALAKLDACC